MDGQIQRSAKVFVRGWEKFFPALAYLFCPTLQVSCLARFAYFFADLCRTRCFWSGSRLAPTPSHPPSANERTDGRRWRRQSLALLSAVVSAFVSLFFHRILFNPWSEWLGSDVFQAAKATPPPPHQLKNWKMLYILTFGYQYSSHFLLP